MQNNPLREIRYAIKPSETERNKRGARDRNKDHLLMRELAKRLSCSLSCICDAERAKDFPKQPIIREAARVLYRKTFGKEPQ